MGERAEIKKFQSKCGIVVEQFLSEMSKGSKNTERSYRTDLRKFFDKVYNKTIDTITSEEVELLDYDSLTQFVNDLLEDNLSNVTINRNVNSIRSLMRFLKARNLIETDISFLDLIKPLKNESIRIQAMTKEVVLNYINGAGRDNNHPELKQQLMILAVDTGLRLEDYLELKWNQFTPQEDWVVMRGYGKGGVEWFEKISYEVYNSLMRLRVEGTKGKDRVFAPLNRKNITDMMSRLKYELGYEDRVYSFHSFKKTAVTFAYRLTGDILEAMKKGKHSDIETTRGYIEEEEYGVTGMFSLGDFDSKAYQNISHEELLIALGELNKDTLHLLNLKIQNANKTKTEVLDMTNII